MSLKEERKKEKERKKRNKGVGPWFYDLAKFTGAIPALLWLRPKYIYQSKAAKRKIKKGGVLFISNHSGYLDPLVLLCTVWYRRLHCVATKELFKGKFNNWLFRHFLCIPVDKENFSVLTFKQIVSRLKAGKAVGIFPEGGINKGENKVEAFKAGAAMMAMRAGVPVVPLYIAKRKRWYSRVRVVAGEPVQLNSTQPHAAGEIDKANDALHSAEEKLAQLYENLYTKKKQRANKP